MINDFIIGLIGLIIACLFFYGMLNGVCYLVCLSSEGSPYWNKAIVACHFNDTITSISQTIITQDSQCFKNGEKINCSYIPEDLGWQNIDKAKKVKG